MFSLSFHALCLSSVYGNDVAPTPPQAVMTTNPGMAAPPDNNGFLHHPQQQAAPHHPQQQAPPQVLQTGMTGMQNFPINSTPGYSTHGSPETVSMIMFDEQGMLPPEDADPQAPASGDGDVESEESKEELEEKEKKKQKIIAAVAGGVALFGAALWAAGAFEKKGVVEKAFNIGYAAAGPAAIGTLIYITSEKAVTAWYADPWSPRLQAATGLAVLTILVSFHAYNESQHRAERAEMRKGQEAQTSMLLLEMDKMRLQASNNLSAQEQRYLSIIDKERTRNEERAVKNAAQLQQLNNKILDIVQEKDHEIMAIADHSFHERMKLMLAKNQAETQGARKEEQLKAAQAVAKANAETMKQMQAKKPTGLLGKDFFIGAAKVAGALSNPIGTLISTIFGPKSSDPQPVTPTATPAPAPAPAPVTPEEEFPITPDTATSTTPDQTTNV